MPSPIVETPACLCCCGQPSWLFELLSRAYHRRPGHARDLIGKRHGGDLDRPALHVICASQRRRVPCCRAYRITAITPLTSSHRKYRFPCLEFYPDAPCRRSNAAWRRARSSRGFVRTELFPITDFSRPRRWRRSNQPLDPPAGGFLRWNNATWIRFLDSSDLSCDRGVLAGKNLEAEPCGRGYPTILSSAMILNSSAVPFAPFARDDASSAR